MTAERFALIGTALAVGVLAGFWILSDERFGRPASAPGGTAAIENAPIDPRIEMHAERFTLCNGPVRVNCVVDGDTLWFKGDKIRIADIDAPEISAPHCEDEKVVGEIARDRLLELLNAGGFSLQSGWRDTDRYGRKLRTVTRSNRSERCSSRRDWRADGTRHDATGVSVDDVSGSIIPAIIGVLDRTIGCGRIVTGGRNRAAGSVRFRA